MTGRPPAPAPADTTTSHRKELTMPTEALTKAPSLPPRWFIRLFWTLQRGLYSVTRGRLGLVAAKADSQGMMRLRTVGRVSGKERIAIVSYFEDGPDLVTMAMNGWAEPEPAWWLNLQARPDIDRRSARWAARRPRPCGGQGRAAAPVGPVGRLRQGSRQLCGPAVPRDRGRHLLAPTRVGVVPGRRGLLGLPQR